MRRPAAVLAAALAVLPLAGCAGADAFETCVEHSVEEGVERSAAETACREVAER